MLPPRRSTISVLGDSVDANRPASSPDLLDDRSMRILELAVAGLAIAVAILVALVR